MNVRFVLVLLLLALPLSGASANGILRLVDETNDEAVVNATVIFRTPAKGSGTIVRRSDERGIVSNPLAGRAVITVFHVGYRRVTDTIDGVGEHVLRLVPVPLRNGEVVVTAQAEPTTTDRALAPVRVLDRAVIEARSARTLRDLLANETGMPIAHDAVLGSSLSLQGLSGQNVKILVDGVPVAGRVGGAIDLEQLSLANAERVEIIEGPMSVLYGTDALGGIVNIISRKRTRGSFSGTAHAQYESVGSYGADASVGAIVDNFRLLVSGGRTLFTGYSNPDTLRSKLWKPREQTTADADATFFMDGHTIGASFGLLDDYILNRGMPRAPYRETAFDETYNTRRTTVRLHGDGNLGETPYEVSAAYTAYDRRRNTFLKNLVTLEMTPSTGTSENDTSIVRTAHIRARVSGRWLFDSVLWDAGVESVSEEIAGGRISDDKRTLGDHALFVRAEYHPTSSLSIAPGIRGGWNTKYSAPVVPSLNVRLGLDTSLVLRASYGRGFRAPSLRDLYYRFVDINHNFYGNPDLRAETSHNLNLGLTWSTLSDAHALEFSANAYYNDVRDLISLVVDSGIVYTYRNIGDVRTVGGAFQADARTTNANARLRVALTGTSEPLAATHDVPTYTIAPELAGEVRWRPLTDVEITADYKYTAGAPQYQLGENDAIERRTSEAYHTVNASVAYTFFDRITLRAAGRNLAGVTDIRLTTNSSGAHGSSDGTMPVAWGRTFLLDLQLRLP